MHCFIFGCPNGCDGPKDQKKARMVQIFFTAPEDEGLFRQWQLIIPRSSNKIFSRGDKLCDLHFKKSEVVLFNETKLPNGNVRRVPALEPKLKAGTIPSIFPKGCKIESETDKNKEPKATTVSEIQKSRGKRKLSSDDSELPETPTSRPRGRPRKVISEGNKEKTSTPVPEKRKKIDPDVESLEAIEEKQYKEIDSDDDSNEELSQATQPTIRLVPLESLLDPSQTKNEDEQAKSSKGNKKRKHPSPSQSLPAAVKKKKVVEMKSSPIKPSESRKKVRENIEEVCAELELAVTDISDDEGAYEIEHTYDVGDEGADLFEIGSIKNGSDDVDQKKTLEELAAELGETDDPDLLNLPGPSSGSPPKPRITQVISLCGMDDEGNLVQHTAKVDSVELEMAKILGEDVEPSCSSDIPISLKTNESSKEGKPEEEHNRLGDSEEKIKKSNSRADEHPPSECSTDDQQIPAKKNLNEEITNAEFDTLETEKSKIPGDAVKEIPNVRLKKMEREVDKPESDADEEKSEADKVKRDTEKSKIDIEAAKIDTDSKKDKNEIGTEKSIIEIETVKGKTEIDTDKDAVESENGLSTTDAEVETGKTKIDENKAETELETNDTQTEPETDKLEEEKEAGSENTSDKLSSIKEIAKGETGADKLGTEAKSDKVEPIKEAVKAGNETETGKKELKKTEIEKKSDIADKVQPIKEGANTETETDKKETEVKSDSSELIKEAAKAEKEIETKSDTAEPIEEADKTEPIKEGTKAEIETERKSDKAEQIKEAAEAVSKETESKSDKVEPTKEADKSEPIKDVAKAETEADEKEKETKADAAETDTLDSNDIKLESTALKENVPEPQSLTEETSEEADVPCPDNEDESNPDEDGSHPSGDSLPNEIRSDSDVKENSSDKNETIEEVNDNAIRNEREENDGEEVEVHSSGSSVILDLSSDSEADPTWAPGPDTIVLSDENDTDPGSNNEDESPTTDDKRKSTSPNKSKGKGKKQGPPPTVEQVAKILHPDALKQILSNLTFPLNGPVALSIADGSTLTGATRIIPKGSTLQNENSPSKFRTRKVQISGERGKKCAKLLGLKMFEGLGKIKKAFDFSTFISDPDDELQFKKFCLLLKECLKDVCESKNAVTNIGKLTIKISHKTIKNESNALSQAIKNAEIISYNESLQDHNESQSLPQVDQDAHQQSASTIKEVHHDNTDEAEMFECMTVDSNVENHYESGPSIENAIEEQTAA